MAKSPPRRPFDPPTRVPTAQPLNPKGLSGRLASQRGAREDTINELPSRAGDANRTTSEMVKKAKSGKGTLSYTPKKGAP